MATHTSDRIAFARLQRWLSVLAYGAFTRTAFRAHTPPHKLRARFERFAARSRAQLQTRFPQLQFRDHALGRISMESISAVPQIERILIHFHGGAFLFGSPASYRQRAQRLSYRCKAEVFVPDYRLAPEHPFPAAFEDALLAYRYVRALRRHNPVIVSGDSAGGGLALSLLLRLRELGEPMPEGAILMSPWTDLSVSGDSVERNHGRDVWLSRRHLGRWASYYAHTSDRRAPLLSPVFGDLSQLPPLLLLVGEHEVLLDDALRVAQRAQRAGTPVQLHVGPRMQHDWPLTLPWLPESAAAWRDIATFVERCCLARTDQMHKLTKNDGASVNSVAAQPVIATPSPT